MSKRILVIDDELDIRDVVCISLEEFGHWETGSASSGELGIHLAQQGPWDAILLDVSMPDLDGFAVFEQLQLSPKTRNIPVILLTAKVLDRDRQNFHQMGIVGVISKPFDPVCVCQQVADLLGWPIHKTLA
jgi:CheY-like chemotaxis protein